MITGDNILTAGKSPVEFRVNPKVVAKDRKILPAPMNLVCRHCGHHGLSRYAGTYKCMGCNRILDNLLTDLVPERVHRAL